MSETIREQVLEQAIEITHYDRNRTNGDPGPHLVQLSRLWSAYLGTEIGPHDVAALMILLKVSRLSRSPDELDHFIDIAGYAACGAEAVHFAKQIGIRIVPRALETAWPDNA